jgi:hypothetical protein
MPNLYQQFGGLQCAQAFSRAAQSLPIVARKKELW